jgi:tight adherence protein B
MDPLLFAFIVLGFLAAMLLFEGVHVAWAGRFGADAKRIRLRIERLNADAAASQANLLRKPPAGVHGWLLQFPGIGQVEMLLQQSGRALSLERFAGMTAGLFVAGCFVAALSPLPAWTVFLAGLAPAAAPLAFVFHRRRQRIRSIESQFPDVLGLMSRAMRAGHSFPSAMQMVASEVPDPIGGEFRAAFEELNYGISVHEALEGLTRRVPVGDLRFFAIAVRLQRDTGGNLAEVLDKLSETIRARLKLAATIRVLSSEGRMSAWILSLLPLVLVLLINLVNPKFMSVLWTDPAGIVTVWAGLGMLFAGIAWMVRMVKMRV